MAININDTSYDGIYLKAFLLFIAANFETSEKGLIARKTGIKSKLKIPRLKLKNAIQAPTSGIPQHSGKVDIDARHLEPQQVLIYLEFDPLDFNDYWTEVEMNPALLDAMLPKSVESAIIQALVAENAEWMDEAIWQSELDSVAIADALANGLGDGDNNLIFFDGLMKRIFLAPGVKKVATPVVLTKANIVGELGRIKASIPKKIWKNKDFKLVVSSNTMDIYGDAQKEQTNKGVDFTEEGKSTFGGKDLVEIGGLADDTIIGTIMKDGVGGNLWYGCNMADEENSLRIDRVANNSEKWFMKAMFTLDTNVAKPEETVYYSTKTYS
ncbi:hypothetical protein [Flammeovirga aprica]|uniref:Phage major capsid protein n=1 Tax=Flammeovirga aprica JL-4 TaxID=694437 RepID=A0A7X9X9R3_9BACT|nr:hypothetical protein [Flammeovirga aprica]NME69011.1 hypothetical protein [Flammeovirga aprica JL-4]